jgi:hypothetical protein
MMACGCIELSSMIFSCFSEDFVCRSKERRRDQRRVAIGDFMLAVVLAVVGAVTGIWFAYIVAAAALLFAAFVWVRASREINGRGGSKRASRS